jgi:hypothetical protein
MRGALQSADAESRGDRFRLPLPSPYRQVVNGSRYARAPARTGNLHVIRLDGVPPEAVKPCIECWCPGSNPPMGAIDCCARCNSTSAAPPIEYFLQFNVTYRVLDTPAAAAAVTPVTVAWISAAAAIEHNIAPTPSPHPLARASQIYALDFFCPQRQPFSIVTCLAHQHPGGACVRLRDAASGALICESCPVYGSGAPGEVGNEPGFLVGMTAADLDPPYRVAPGQVVRAESDYLTDQPYAGVMSYVILALAGFEQEECRLGNMGLMQVGGAAAPLTHAHAFCSLRGVQRPLTHACVE